MPKLYPSEEGIQSCINYFKSLTIDSGEQLGLFFFFKSIGFSTDKYCPFPKVGSISDDERKELLKKLYLLSGIFDVSIENGEKACCLFPFSIKPSIGKTDLFNQGTPFKGLLSRLRDTVDNTLIDKFLQKDDSNPDNFKFPKNYASILNEKYLHNKKISLVYFSLWYFRFREIECPAEWLDNPTPDIYKGFTRICKKKLISELKLTEDDLSNLFYQSEDEFFSFSTTKIKGSKLRSFLSFNDVSPEITTHIGVKYMNDATNISLTEAQELALPLGKNMDHTALFNLLSKTKQVILYGVPGTSKSFVTNQIKEKFTASVQIQFHASMNYEQFICGISIDNNGNFTSKAGIFLTFCENARKHQENKYLFIIDEINRGNVSKIFGETILTLDREYTADLSNEIKLSESETISKFSIPSNVYILCTMNSADRSIAQIDYAIRRRFAFVKFYPNYELVSAGANLSGLPGINPSTLFKQLNQNIFNVLKDENMILGHAYFIPKWALSENKINWTPEVLKELINYYIIPIIEEYTYGNPRYLTAILGSELPKRIQDNDQFINEIKKQFKL